MACTATLSRCSCGPRAHAHRPRRTVLCSPAPAIRWRTSAAVSCPTPWSRRGGAAQMRTFSRPFWPRQDRYFFVT
eukprot:5066261-Pleurochrysis_carterae.AAC.3